MNRETVVSMVKRALERLKVEKLDILYFHSPETRVPVEDALAGIDELYKSGAFVRLGLSNYSAAQIEETVKVCKENGYVLPTIFQGSYSAVARLCEEDIIPVLRKHNISFLAYSPGAGGFLSKTSSQFRENRLQGRWDPDSWNGKISHYMYNRPEALQALDTWHEIARDAQILPMEMAYRWVAYNSQLDASKGDGLVVGASTLEQWEMNLQMLRKGPLKAELAERIERLWKAFEGKATLDNLQAVLAMLKTNPVNFITPA